MQNQRLQILCWEFFYANDADLVAHNEQDIQVISTGFELTIT